MNSRKSTTPILIMSRTAPNQRNGRRHWLTFFLVLCAGCRLGSIWMPNEGGSYASLAVSFKWNQRGDMRTSKRIEISAAELERWACLPPNMAIENKRAEKRGEKGVCLDEHMVYRKRERATLDSIYTATQELSPLLDKHQNQLSSAQHVHLFNLFHSRSNYEHTVL